MKSKKYTEKVRSGEKVSEPITTGYGFAADMQIPEFLKPYRNEITELCKKHHVQRLYVFGSVLTDDFTTDSDLDFIIKIKEVSVKVYTDSFFEVYAGLKKILNRKIDLITEPSISNPYFLEEVNKTKLLIYGE